MKNLEQAFLINWEKGILQEGGGELFSKKICIHENFSFELLVFQIT